MKLAEANICCNNVRSNQRFQGIIAIQRQSSGGCFAGACDTSEQFHRRKISAVQSAAAAIKLCGMIFAARSSLRPQSAAGTEKCSTN